ncbi:MAG: SRPBCC family protein [Acidimicrobiia bacterium]
MQRGLHVELSDFIERTETFSVSRNDLWKAISDPAYLSQWFGMECLELDLKVGGRVLFAQPSGRKRAAVVEAVDPPNRLSFKWLPFDIGPDGRTQPASGSIVELTLSGDEHITELTVRERGVPMDRATTIQPIVIDAGSPQRNYELMLRG